MRKYTKVCPQCKEEIRVGDQFFEYWDNSYSCDNTKCVLDHFCPDELNEYAVEFCKEDDYFNNLTIEYSALEYSRDQGSCFIDWLEEKQKITRKETYEKYII